MIAYGPPGDFDPCVLVPLARRHHHDRYACAEDAGGLVFCLDTREKHRLDFFVADNIPGNQETAIGIIHQIGPLGARPPAVKRALSAMPHHNKIRPNLPSNVPNFFSGLASHQFRRGIETQLPQSRDALVKYVREVIFHMNKCSSEARLGQQKRTGINEHRQEKDFGTALTCQKGALSEGGAPFYRSIVSEQDALIHFKPLPCNQADAATMSPWIMDELEKRVGALKHASCSTVPPVELVISRDVPSAMFDHKLRVAFCFSGAAAGFHRDTQCKSFKTLVCRECQNLPDCCQKLVTKEVKAVGAHLLTNPPVGEMGHGAY
jgi:hypothetical protein